ncbi:hypothetical protein CANMA_004385 [Candida margitis]|uniref:uncharacterized protein n=1 Tax=Candida margitis TaxID=1775924 RepID=UPI0022279ED0|nr:uncharacterized protein CANMA_004385 [Candida margitis]KAI5957874.1 hypothetical protein CANMA_004385 [Candida margitis]
MSSNDNNSKDDIRLQLSDMQRRLFTKKSSHNTLRESTSSNSQQSQQGTHPLSQHHDQENAFASSLHQERRTSSGLGLPAVKRSKKIEKSHPSLPLAAESKGNDMNFVVGLSDNLMIECRRLNADNSKLKSKLKQALQDAQTLKAETIKLSNSNQTYSSNESELKDKNWSLESKVSSLQDDLQALEKSNDKLKALQEDMNNQLNHITKNNDELDITNSLLSKKLKDMHTRYEKDIMELSQRVESLNDENDVLQSKLATIQPAAAAKDVTSSPDTSKQSAIPMGTYSNVYVSGLESILKELEQVEGESLSSKSSNLSNAISRLKTLVGKVPSQDVNSQSTKQEQEQDTPLIKEVPSSGGGNRTEKKIGKLSKLSTGEGTDRNDFLEKNIESTSIQDFPSTTGKHIEHVKDTKSVADIFSQFENLPKNSEHDAKLAALIENRGMKVLTTTEYQKLVDKVESIKSLPEGVTSIPEAKLKELEQKAQLCDQPDIKYITNRAQSLGLVAIDSHTYKELNELANNPNIEHISQKAKQHNKYLISNEELQHFLHPKEDQIREKAKNLNLKVLTESEITSLQNPSLASVNDLASKHDHVLMPSVEHNKTRKMIDSPTLDYLKKHLTAHEHTPMGNKELQDLLQRAKNPSITEVQQHAEKKGLTTLTKEEHEELSSLAHKPSLEHLEQAADKKGYALVEKQNLEKLQTMASSPPVSHLNEVASKNNMTLVSRTEYEELQRLSTQPDLEHVKGVASKINYSVVSNDEYASIVKKAEDPDLEHVKDVASKLSYSVVSNDDLEELKKKAEDPTIEQIETVAQKKNLAVVANDEYTSIVKNANEPDLEHIKYVSTKLNHQVIDRSEFNEIERRANKPTIEEIESRASCMGMVVVDYKTYQNLCHPAEKDLRSHCDNLNLHLCHKSEFKELCDKLEHPDMDYLKDSAEKLDLSLIDNRELSTLKEKANEPDLAHLEEKARVMHYVVLPEDKFNSMERQLTDPSADEVKESAKSLGLVVLEEQEHSKLTNPSRVMLEKTASIYGCSVVTTEKMGRLEQLESNPSKEFLVSRASEKELVVMPKKEFNELSAKANNPSKEHLAQKAKEIGFVAIPLSDHETSRSQLDNPTIDFLKEKAQLYDQELVSSSTLTSLQNIVNDPSLEYLTGKAREHHATIVDSKEYNSLIESHASPSTDQIRDNALKNGYDIVQLDELAELKKIRDDPNVDDVRRMAAALDLVVLSESEHVDLSHRIDSPSIDYLKEHANKLNYTMVKSQDYDELAAFVESPSKEFITEKAHFVGLAAVPEEEYLVLCHRANDPDLDELMAQAKSKKMTLINIDELESLHSQLNTPNADYLSEHAEKAGSVIIPKEEFAVMKQSIESPSEEYLKEQCGKHKLAVLSESELTKLKSCAESPSVDFLVEKAEARDYKVIKKADFLDIVKKVENPDMEHLNKCAAERNVVLVPDQEYKSLLEPSRSLIEERALTLGLGVIAKPDLDKLKKCSDSPDIEHLNAKSKALGHELINCDQLVSLRSSIENPSQNYLKQKAESIGCVVIEKSELDHLQSVANSKALEASTITDPNRDVKEAQKADAATVKFETEEQPLRELSDELRLADDNETALTKMEHYLKNHGYTIIPATVSRSVSNSSTTDPNEFDDAENTFEGARDHQLPLNVKDPIKDSDRLTKTISRGTLAHAANLYSLSLVPDSEYISLQSNRLDKERLENRIKEIIAKLSSLELDLVEREQVVKCLESENPQLEEGISVRHIKSSAKGLGFLCINATDYVGTTTHPHPDVNHVKVLPASYFSQLLKYKSTSVEKLSDDAFGDFAKKRGYVKKSSKVLDVPQVPFGSGNNSEPGVLSHSLGHTGSRDGTHTPPMVHPSRQMTHSGSIRSNLSEFSTTSLRSNGMFSMATDVSFTDKSMIPAITQVVIGEYLFKYYRRFGSAFSMIAETRHERYFWVHPYSLTLYWSESSPVLSNPASRKTRAAAIVDVDSVDDNNPIPTGLYHKSIIVHSTDRAIKITCATRQRHNIWYNALRYLIHRNIDALSVDEDVDDDGDIEASPISNLVEFPKSTSHRNLEALRDTGDRRAFPRPKRVSSQEGVQTPRTPGGVSRLSSFRRS